MKKRILTMLLATILVMAMVMPLAANAAEMRWVKTGNGKGLRVRTEPNTDADVLRTLSYGEQVAVDYDMGNGWTALFWGSYGTAYVMSRYLVNYDPGPYNPDPSPTAKPTSQQANPKESTTVKQLNTLVANARQVSPYTITVRPTRSSGWVYLRWFPTRHASELGSYADGKQLTVIAELKDWYQVEDPDDGRTGFVYKSYVR